MSDPDSLSSSFNSPRSLSRATLTRRESFSGGAEAQDALLLEEQFPMIRRGSHRFDVTAAGTTARLHSSLVGRSSGIMAPLHLLDDEYDDYVEQVPISPLGESSATRRPSTPTAQQQDEAFDPEKTPLLGSRRPPRPSQHIQETEGSSSSQASPPLPDHSLKQGLSSGATAPERSNKQNALQRAASQIPAIALIALFHLMIGIPFGVSYFPVGWSTTDTANGSVDDASSDVHGPFPLPGKEAVGIRMFLFSTAVGQIVFTLQSQFRNAIGLQMVENVPFCQALAATVIRHQGYGAEALSTTLVIYAISSVVVGLVFWVLGRYRLGRIIYFFPTVRVRCVQVEFVLASSKSFTHSPPLLARTDGMYRWYWCVSRPYGHGSNHEPCIRLGRFIWGEAVPRRRRLCL